MKKKDIVKVLKATKTIADLQKILSYTKEKVPFNTSWQIKDEKDWLPDIKGLEPQLEILKQEIKQAKKDNDKAINDLKKCTHDVRISTYEDVGICFFGDSESHKCVLCNSDIAKPRQNNWYEDTRAVVIKNNKQFDGDYWYSYAKGMSQKEIMSIIFNILDKYEEDDEIDLIAEFANLNLKEKDIVTYDPLKSNKSLILIIGGSNTCVLEGSSKYYLTKELSDVSVQFLEHFSNILNTKIVLIDRKETIKKPIFDEYRKCDWIKLITYEYLDEVEKELGFLTNVRFKTIIDLSSFYKLNIFDNQINEEEYSLNLKEYFPDSDIIQMRDVSEIECHNICHKTKKLLR